MAQNKKKLRILHLVLSIGETNATYNEHCLPVADKRELSICTYFKSEMTPPKKIAYFEGNNSFLGFIRLIRKVLRNREFDIIHAHTPHVGLLLLIATGFSFGRIKSKTVITVHDSYQNFKIRNRLFYLPIFAFFERVICCSQSSFESFPMIYKLLAGKRLGFVQNGLDIDRVDRIAQKSSRQVEDHREGFKVIAISRLVKIKNPFTLISAFRKSNTNGSSLLYIGDGPLRESLIEKSVEQNNGSKVEFSGLIPREKVFYHLLNSDVYITTSLGEGLPVAVLEAMACGSPVILSDIPPHREIAEGVDFIPIVMTNDISGFASEITKFYEMSPSERAEIGKKCRALVENKFSLDAMHAGYDEVYASVTKK